MTPFLGFISRSFLKIKSFDFEKTVWEIIGFFKLRFACSMSYKSEIKLYRKLQKNILFIVLFVCLFLYSLTTLNSFIDLPVWQLIDFARSLSTQLYITHLDLLLSLNDLHYAHFVEFTWLNCTPISLNIYFQKPYRKF